MKRVPAAIAAVLMLSVLGACGAKKADTATTPDSSRTPVSPSSSPSTATVPPTGSGSTAQVEDALRAFFRLIDDGRAADAVAAMSSANTADDASRQAWAVQFDAVTSVKLLSATPSAPAEWTASRRTYEVLLDVVMDSASADAPIPYYGYANGENVRWVTLVTEEGVWKIDAIATGP